MLKTDDAGKRPICCSDGSRISAAAFSEYLLPLPRQLRRGIFFRNLPVEACHAQLLHAHEKNGDPATGSRPKEQLSISSLSLPCRFAHSAHLHPTFCKYVPARPGPAILRLSHKTSNHRIDLSKLVFAIGIRPRPPATVLEVFQPQSARCEFDFFTTDIFTRVRLFRLSSSWPLFSLSSLSAKHINSASKLFSFKTARQDTRNHLSLPFLLLDQTASNPPSMNHYTPIRIERGKPRLFYFALLCLQNSSALSGPVLSSLSLLRLRIFSRSRHPKLQHRRSSCGSLHLRVKP